MKTNQNAATRRPIIYWTFFLAFLLGGGPILKIPGLMPEFVHPAMDGIAALLIMAASVFVFKAYKKTKAPVLGIVAVAFLGTAVFEFLHIFGDSQLIETWRASEPQVFMPWTWNVSQLFLSSMLLIAALLSDKEVFGKTSSTSAQRNILKIVSVIAAIAVPAIIFVMLRADLSSVYIDSTNLKRPLDMVSGAIFAIGALTFGLKGNWRRDSYGHWIVIALIAGLCAQFFLMAFAKEPFGANFTIAHILKISTYGFIAWGFVRSQKICAAVSDSEDTKPRGLSMGAKLAILCGFIAFITVMPLAIKSTNTLHDMAANNGITNLSNAAKTASLEITEQRLRVSSDLNYLANVTSSGGLELVANGDLQNSTRELSLLTKNLLLSDPEYFSIAYIDAATGSAVVRNEQSFNAGIAVAAQLTLESSTRELVEQALENNSRQPIVRSKIIRVQDTTNRQNLQIEGTALTVYGADSEAPIGVFVIHSNVSREFASTNQAEYATSLYVVNSDGRFIVHPDESKEIGQNNGANYTIADEFPGLNFVALTADDAVGGSMYKNTSGTELFVGADRLPATGGTGEDLLYIYTGLKEDVERDATEIGYENLGVAQATLLFAVVLGWFFAGRLARPVKDISAAAVEFGRSGEIREMPIDGRDEIGMLAKSLNDMMTEVNGQRGKLVLLAAAVESSVDSIIISDDQGRVVYVNPQYEKYAGVDGESLMGKYSNELPEFKDHMNILSEAPSVKSGETVWTGQYVWRRPDGKMHDESLTISPIRDTDGKIINHSMIIQDVTERRQMEKDIEAKAEELMRSNKDLEQFAYVASHDLKAPLRAIEVILEWLREDLEEYDEGDVQENLTLLGQRTSRLGRLLEDLLAYSRAGRKVGDVRNLDMKAFVEDIATLVAPPEGMKIIADRSLPQLTAHHAPLETVLRNLISNAIKHHPDPEHGTIKISAKDQGESVIFSVEDDGDGIPEEYAAKVFKMFQTLKPRDDCEGSGMGLAIVQRIITWQAGTIWFENGENGKGIVFKFVWNRSVQDMPEIEEEDTAATGIMKMPMAG